MKSKTMSIRIGTSLSNEIETIAEENRCSRQQLLMRWVLHGVAEHRKHPTTSDGHAPVLKPITLGDRLNVKPETFLGREV